METSKAKQIWAQACEFLSSAMSTDIFHRWIGVIEAVGDEGPGQLTLAVPNGFYQDWLEEEWIKELRNKYLVIIDDKVYEEVKRRLANE